MLEVRERGGKWWPVGSGDNRGPDHSGSDGEGPACGHTGRPHMGLSVHTPGLPQPPPPRTWSKAQSTALHGKTFASLSLSAVYVYV